MADDELPDRRPGESLPDFARRRAQAMGLDVSGAATPRKGNRSATYDNDLIPDISPREAAGPDAAEQDDFINAVDILGAYRRWCRKMEPRTGNRRESIMVSCPNPLHPDVNPSAWINLDIGSGGVGNCALCGGFDKYDIAAWHFGFDVPGYKSKADFPRLKRRMAEDLGWISRSRPTQPSRQTASDDGGSIANASSGRLVLRPASSVRMRRVSWLWEGRVPVGALTLTPGRGGIGKSTFHAWIVAEVTRGTLDGRFFGTPMSAIIAATEDSWEYTIAPRLVAAGADLDRVYRIDVDRTTSGETTISLPADVEELSELIRSHEVALLSVDPLLAFLSESIDSHKDEEVRDALRPLTAMAEHTDCAVVGNAHFTKSGTDPMTSIMGSAAFGNVARAALAFARGDDGAGVMSQVKNNLGRLDQPSLRYRLESVAVQTEDGPSDVGRLVWDGISNQSVGEILGDTRSQDERTAGRDAEAFLVDYLTRKGGTAPAGEVIAAALEEGISKRTLQRARKACGVETKQQLGGHRWSMPSDRDLVPTL